MKRKYIVIVKDEKNEISLVFTEVYEVTNFTKTILEKSDYIIEIETIMEE